MTASPAAGPDSAVPTLEVRDLVTSFRTDHGVVRAVDRVDLRVERGRTLALVGESGCGKSVTALSIMRLIPTDNGSIDSGSVRLGGEELLSLSRDEMRRIRGNRISMIFQEPMTALNPVYTIGRQVQEVFRIHRGLDGAAARREATRLLDMVKIPEPARRLDEYPFQMSGGMLQRVMIAMALACEPDLLIADEPTTALDVTIQAQILSLMRQLQEEHGTAILFITHDLGVVAQLADEVAIMYAGHVVERGPVVDIFQDPLHPYTQGLLRSIPSLDRTKEEPLETIEGTVPGLRDLPEGCRFHPRCRLAAELCRREDPALEPPPGAGGSDLRRAACHAVAGRLPA